MNTNALPLSACIAVAALAGMAGPGSAQQAPQRDTVLYVLEPIEATAARERATAPPVATITVDPELIRETQSENPYDLMRRITGIEVHDQGQGPGFASNVVLRGFTSDHSSDVLLTVDGVPVNLPVHGHVEGYADWNFLFPGAVSSLRVVHGPASPLHGDFAIAGAVELYTQADGDGVRGSVSGNQFGDAAGWVTVGTRRDGGGGLAGLELRRTEGWRNNAVVEIGNVLLRGWRTVGEGRLEGGLALHRGSWGSPGFLSMAEFQDGLLDGPADRTDGGEQSRVVVHGRYATPVSANSFLQAMAWGVTSDWELYLTSPGHEDAFGDLYQTGEADARWGAGSDVEWSWLPEFGEVTLGTSVRTDRSEYDKDRTLRRRAVEGEVALDARHTAAAVYLRWRRTLFDRLGLDIGGRVDHLRYESFNRLGLDEPVIQAAALPVRAEFPINYHVIGDQGPVGEWVDGSRTIASPKLGARFALDSRWSLMASSSRGFRSPVGVVGDPDRDPFLAWAHEVGLDYERSGLDAHLSLFRVSVTNERIQDPLTLEISSAGSSVRQGIELEASWEGPGGITLAGRGTLTDAQLSGRYADAHHDHADESALPYRFERDGWRIPDRPSAQVTPGEEESPGGQRVPGIASYQASLSAAFPVWGDVEGRVEWRRTGDYVPIGEPDVKTDSFAVVDLGVAFPVRDDVLVEVEMRNAFDTIYPEMRSSGYVSPGAPRSLGVAMVYAGY